eukprot:356607-Chlamydomonas_euryale.AAC.4
MDSSAAWYEDGQPWLTWLLVAGREHAAEGGWARLYTFCVSRSYTRIGGTIWGLSAPNGAPMGRCGMGRAAGAPKTIRRGAAACRTASTQGRVWTGVPVRKKNRNPSHQLVKQPWRPWPDALANASPGDGLNNLVAHLS